MSRQKSQIVKNSQMKNLAYFFFFLQNKEDKKFS